MSNKLYVGGLSYSTSQSELEDLFAKQGTVVSAVVINDRDTGRSKGFGFVEMANEGEANAAIGELHGIDFNGRNLTVNTARKRESRRPETVGGW